MEHTVPSLCKALIVEDESLSRQALREMVDAVPWLQCCAEARDGREACELIDRYNPDVVFLDVRIPELTGLEVLAKIEVTPFIVFTTAHVDFAVDAFEHGAVDYLVKPFGERRFRRTLDRIRERLEARSASQSSTNNLSRVFVQNGESVLPLNINTVQFFEAAGDYVVAQRDDEQFVLSTSLGNLEKRLNAHTFVRIHRSIIVNLQKIANMRKEDDRRIVLTLDNGMRVVASRSGSAKLRRLCL